MVKKIFWIALVIAVILDLGVFAKNVNLISPGTTMPVRWWDVQSIDTMKYSRDLAQEKNTDTTFASTIDAQVGDIAATGANYVAIGTPYDPEFSPYLQEWVAAARKYQLHVWFRGNFSGWEGWFGYPKMTAAAHETAIVNFIKNNASLFADGDIFTPCPECENGALGDPRNTGGVTDFRAFLVGEYQAAGAAFKDIGKSVTAGYDSENYDVARLVMDQDTCHALGGVIVVDHYVSDPTVLVSNLSDLAAATGCKIVLGEFGAPIPDVNGDMTEVQQADWLSRVMTLLAKEPSVVGVNYWTSVGGSTALWNDSLVAHPAVATLTQFYKPVIVDGVVRDTWGSPIRDASVMAGRTLTFTDGSGRFSFPLIGDTAQVKVSDEGYTTGTATTYKNTPHVTITLQESHSDLWVLVKNYLRW